MSSVFDGYVVKLEGLFAELINSSKQRVNETSRFPISAGCYALSEANEYLYVGIGKNIRRRIRNHIAGRAEKSAFAFRLARLHVNAPVTYRREGGRSDLMTQPLFVEAMRSTTERVRAMCAQVVLIEDPSLLYLFEFYAAKRLNTPYNSFNVH